MDTNLWGVMFRIIAAVLLVCFIGSMAMAFFLGGCVR